MDCDLTLNEEVVPETPEKLPYRSSFLSPFKCLETLRESPIDIKSNSLNEKELSNMYCLAVEDEEYDPVFNLRYEDIQDLEILDSFIEHTGVDERRDQSTADDVYNLTQEITNHNTLSDMTPEIDGSVLLDGKITDSLIESPSNNIECAGDMVLTQNPVNSNEVKSLNLRYCDTFNNVTIKTSTNPDNKTSDKSSILDGVSSYETLPKTHTLRGVNTINIQVSSKKSSDENTISHNSLGSGDHKLAASEKTPGQSQNTTHGIDPKLFYSDSKKTEEFVDNCRRSSKILQMALSKPCEPPRKRKRMSENDSRVMLGLPGFYKNMKRNRPKQFPRRGGISHKDKKVHDVSECYKKPRVLPHQRVQQYIQNHLTDSDMKRMNMTRETKTIKLGQLPKTNEDLFTEPAASELEIGKLKPAISNVLKKLEKIEEEAIIEEPVAASIKTVQTTDKCVEKISKIPNVLGDISNVLNVQHLQEAQDLSVCNERSLSDGQIPCNTVKNFPVNSILPYLTNAENFPRLPEAISTRVQNNFESSMQGSPPKRGVKRSLFPSTSVGNKITDYCLARRLSSSSDDQYILDAGQKILGNVIECRSCKLVYSDIIKEDAALHSKFHNKLFFLKHEKWSKETVVKKFDTGRVIAVTKSDSKRHKMKVQDVLNFIEDELGQDPNVFGSFSKVYLYVSKGMILGCLVMEPITKAHKNLSLTSDSLDICSKESYHVTCGIRRIWVAHGARRQGIATKLVESGRGHFREGRIIHKKELAICSPSFDGKEFFAKYVGTRNYLVYD